MKIGLIGTGNMGSILAEALIESQAISPHHLYIINRTPQKAFELQKQFPDIIVCPTISEVIQTADLIFLCVKPAQYHDVITHHQSYFTKDKCLVSITSPVSVKQISPLIHASCARIIPSITNRALAGVSLMTFDEQCSNHWKEKLHQLFSPISKPIEIEQQITRVASDIVSCGPAFFSYLTRKFIEGAVEVTEIEEETATILASEMLIGLGELLRKGHYTLPTLQEKVCVKGGVTGEGIAVLEKELGDMFVHLFEATHKKFDEDLAIVHQQFATRA